MICFVPVDDDVFQRQDAACYSDQITEKAAAAGQGKNAAGNRLDRDIIGNLDLRRKRKVRSDFDRGFLPG